MLYRYRATNYMKTILHENGEADNRLSRGHLFRSVWYASELEIRAQIISDAISNCDVVVFYRCHCRINVAQ